MPDAELLLEAWIDRLETLDPDRIDLGLERIGTVFERLGKPTPGRESVVVAGTNGKGSCIAIMRRLAEATGRTAGCYTSPHLVRFNERILLPAGDVDDASLVRAFEAVEEARGDTYLSWFEFTTLAAFVLLAEADLDLALLEIGLGGRLDAVNLIDGSLSVVTGIALDHCNWLGPDRETIGPEKAAVYRPGRTAVCGDPEPPESLLAHIRAVRAKPLLAGQAGQGYDWRQTGGSWDFQMRDRQFEQLPLPGLPLQPCAAGLAAFLDLFPETTEAQVQRALRGAQLPGRSQYLPAAPALLMDVAHNPQAVEALAQCVTQLRHPDGELHWLFGASKDKDMREMIGICERLGGVWHPVVAQVKRAAPAAAVAEAIQAAGCTLSPQTEASPVAATLARVRRQAGKNDLVVVCGSFYVVGEALQWLADEVDGAVLQVGRVAACGAPETQWRAK